MKKIMKGTEALLLSLLAEGVDTIFGYPGGSIMPLYDELYGFSDRLRHILVRHEQGAVHAAEGYARATGKTGVCMATAGPGATNLVTGIADAMMDSTPIVCITAQVSSDVLGTNFFQEADMIGITTPITKWNYQITQAEEVPRIIAKAFRIARSGRPGPVVVSISKDAQIGYCSFESDRPTEPETTNPAIPTEKLETAVRWINASARPLLVYGQGIILSGCEKELTATALKGNIPVASTLLGLSAVASDFPLFAGNLGMHGNLSANRMTQECDLLIAVGMRFSDRVTGVVSKYAPNARILHIEIDKAEINKTVHSDLFIQADAGDFLSAALPLLEYKERTTWINRASELQQEEYESVSRGLLCATTGISMARVIDTIARKGDSVVVTDVGQNQMFAARYSRFSRTRSFITSGGLGTMGYGLPAGIGAKIGVPQREVVVVTGDGGFQMSVQELGTIMQYRIPVKIVVLNNSFLGMVRQWQELFFEKRYSSTPLQNPDFVALCEAYGIRSRRVCDPLELDAAVEEMLCCEEAYFLEVRVNEEENVFPMVPVGASLSEMMVKKTK